MVECDGLENRCTGFRTVGSNPTLSVSNIKLEISNVELSELKIGNNELMDRRISEIDAIEKPFNLPVYSIDDLKELVEYPLLPACEELYDKGIVTLASSANGKDIGYQIWRNPRQSIPGEGAYIVIDYEGLSKTNKEIGMGLGEIFFTDNRCCLKITFPLTEESTVLEVQTMSLDVVHLFVPQIRM